MAKPKRVPECVGTEPAGDTDARREELRRRRDRIGLRYLRAAQLRQVVELSNEDREFLKNFDAQRELAKRDPDQALSQAHTLIHEGMMLLETVIEEHRVNRFDEKVGMRVYDAMVSLHDVALNLHDDVIRYAEDGSRIASLTIFHGGKALASAFARLAIAYPDQFHEFTERSLTMPSLRTRDPNFMADADEIIEAIQLGRRHHASGGCNTRSRLGALCHPLVAHWVDITESARIEAVKGGPNESEWRNVPELGNDAQRWRKWWEPEIKEWINREFERMRRDPNRNPGLWQELEKLTDRGTDSEKRAVLEKYCLNKLRQLARQRTVKPKA